MRNYSGFLGGDGQADQGKTVLMNAAIAIG